MQLQRQLHQYSGEGSETSSSSLTTSSSSTSTSSGSTASSFAPPSSGRPLSQSQASYGSDPGQQFYPTNSRSGESNFEGMQSYDTSYPQPPQIHRQQPMNEMNPLLPLNIGPFPPPILPPINTSFSLSSSSSTAPAAPSPALPTQQLELLPDQFAFHHGHENMNHPEYINHSYVNHSGNYMEDSQGSERPHASAEQLPPTIANHPMIQHTQAKLQQQFQFQQFQQQQQQQQQVLRQQVQMNEMNALYRHPHMQHPALQHPTQHLAAHPPPMKFDDEASRMERTSSRLGIKVETKVDPLLRVIRRNAALGRAAKIEKGRLERAKQASKALEPAVPLNTQVNIESVSSETDLKQEVMAPERALKDLNEPQVAILYMPGATLPIPTWYVNMLIEVRIQAKHMTLANKEVSTRQLWGTDIYTEESDVVAILRHCGRFILHASLPTGCLGVSAIFRILPPRKEYLPSTRYGYRSRRWSSEYTKTSLEFIRSDTIHNAKKFYVKTKATSKDGRRKVRLVRATFPDPFFRPRNFLEHVKPTLPGATIVFNGENDPTIKYSLDAVCDRGVDQKLWTSMRMKREALVLEANGTCYELSRLPSSKGKYDAYRWAKVIPDASFSHLLNLSRRPRTQKRKKSEGAEGSLPLSVDRISVLETDLDWDEIEWGPSAVRVRGQLYPVQYMLWKPLSVEDS